MVPDELLAPISTSKPGGDDLSDDEQFILLNQSASGSSFGKEVDWMSVEDTAASLLTTKSKDLRIAVLYTEALVHRLGFGGLSQGLGLLHGLLDKYWDTVHPLDHGHRRGPLAKLASEAFTIDVQLQPITAANQTFWDYRQSASMPSAEVAGRDDKQRIARQRMLDDGKVSPEAFEEGVADTPRSFYKQLTGNLAASLSSLQRIDAVSKQRFGKDEAPSYRDLRLALESVSTVAKQLLDKKPPDPNEAPDVPEPSADGESTGASPTSDSISAAVSTVADAESRVVAAAHFLRKANPESPAPYLLLRALRWGELRSGSTTPDARLLAAPDPSSRSRLRSFYLDQRWDGLLEACELVMATPAGRGWLDLQFYAVRAAEALGGPFDRVRHALVSQLHDVLIDLPSLREMTLMDAMPTASPETKAWIEQEIVNGAAPAGPRAQTQGDASSESGAQGDVYAAARREASAGKPDQAIQLLTRELLRETSERGRFLRRLQIATIMVDNGLMTIARPVLQQIVEQVHSRSLAEWEEPSVVAQPYALMIRCLDASEDESGRRNEYYEIVCRLSPAQALGLTRG
jgi:type VI secretion system protein ImpA